MKEQSGMVGGQWCCSATGATEVGELCAESEGLYCGNVTQLEDTQLVGGRREAESSTERSGGFRL